MQNDWNQPLVRYAEEAHRGFMHEAMVAPPASLPEDCILWRTGFLRGRFCGVLFDGLMRYSKCWGWVL